MIDLSTRSRLRVSTGETAGPYIMVPLAQLEELRAMLDERQITYWVDSDAISLDGAPEIAVVNLGRSSDAQAIQAVLDNHP